jgi:hypothetical protein
MPRRTPNPAEAARRLAGDLAMRLQTPLLPDEPDARLTAGGVGPFHRPAGLSTGEAALLEVCSAIVKIGLHSLDLDIHLRRSVASTLRRLAEVIDQ